MTFGELTVGSTFALSSDPKRRCQIRLMKISARIYRDTAPWRGALQQYPAGPDMQVFEVDLAPSVFCEGRLTGG